MFVHTFSLFSIWYLYGRCINNFIYGYVCDVYRLSHHSSLSLSNSLICNTLETTIDTIFAALLAASLVLAGTTTWVVGAT